MLILFSRDEILNEVPNLTEKFTIYLELNQTICQTEDELQDLHQQLALIKEAEAQGVNKHSLYSLPSHYDAYHQSQEAMNTAKKDLDNIIADCEKHIEVYRDLLNSYETQKFSQWIVDIKITKNEESMHVFDLVKEFLHNAGKDDLIAQCEQSEQEVFQSSQLLNVAIRKCVQVYQEYFSFILQCPKSYLETHRCHLFLKWANYLIEMKNCISCDVIYEKLKEFIESAQIVNNPHVVSVAYSLETFYKENLVQVNKLFDELATIRTKEVKHSLDKLYNNAKTGINTFLGCEKGAQSALEFVIASELVLLNRTLLTLEIAAQRSGDWLIKLTSREGDWFLDDLLLHSNRAVEIISNLPPRQNPAEDSNFFKILNGIEIATSIYKGLYDLNFNFHTIILSESMKKIQCEEISVIQLIYDLNRVVHDIGLTIPDIIIQLDKLLTCVLMQMETGVSMLLVVKVDENASTYYIKSISSIITRYPRSEHPNKMR